MLVLQFASQSMSIRYDCWSNSRSVYDAKLLTGSQVIKTDVSR